MKFYVDNQKIGTNIKLKKQGLQNFKFKKTESNEDKSIQTSTIKLEPQLKFENL